MREVFIVGVTDLQFVCIKCQHCQTRVILDLAGEFKLTGDRGTFTPRQCPGCRVPFDSAVQPNIDSLQRVYQTLAALKDTITFQADPDREKE